MATQNNGRDLLVAVKEVNTPEASIGDVISYTITLTNTTNDTITNIGLTDIIDRSLQVETNSIGINGVVSSRQSLDYLMLPDLAPGGQNEVVFNTYIMRAPQQADYTLRQQAIIFFEYQGERYSVETNVVLTKVNITDTAVNYLSSSLQTDRENAVVGDVVSFRLQLYPNGYFNICDIQLGLIFDNHWRVLPKTLRVNGCYTGEDITQMVLPNLVYNDLGCMPIHTIEFKAKVISQPTVIRPFAIMRGVVQYRICGLNDIFIINTEEALVEVL